MTYILYMDNIIFDKVLRLLEYRKQDLIPKEHQHEVHPQLEL